MHGADALRYFQLSLPPMRLALALEHDRRIRQYVGRNCNRLFRAAAAAVAAVAAAGSRTSGGGLENVRGTVLCAHPTEALALQAVPAHPKV
jgi:hypothetical protein